MLSETSRRVFLAVAEASFADDDDASPASHAYGLAAEMGLDRSTTGRHLRALADVGLVEPTSSGRRTEYRVTDGGAELVEFVQNNTDIYLGETKQDVLRFVADVESVHGYLLAEGLGLQRSNAYRHLSDLESKGLLEATRNGRTTDYKLTDSGLTLAGVLSR